MKIDEVIKTILETNGRVKPFNFSTFHDLRTKEYVKNIYFKYIQIFYKVQDDTCKRLIKSNNLSLAEDSVLNHKERLYFVLNEKLHEISYSDLEDKDYLFNLNLILSTEMIKTLEVAKSVSSSTESSFILYSDAINIRDS